MMRSVLPATTEAGGSRRSVTATRRRRGTSRKRVLALIVAGLAVGSVSAAGGAAAESLSGSDHSGRSGSHGDSTGWHAIDPFGYQHSDPNPLRQNEHRDALRDYHRRKGSESGESGASNGAGDSAWTRTQRPDGSGWTVCRPHAKWC